MKNLLKALTLLTALVLFLPAQAQRVDTISVYSPSMGREIRNVIILPENYGKNPNESYPVLYLLHGYSGRHDSWIKLKPELPQIVSRYGIIIVCPNGENSWYWDSPRNPKSKFETFVSSELVKYIDKNYKTKANIQGRAITGLSMGGHGGLWLGIRHQDIFGACGSMSGGVDIRPFPDNWEMKTQLGEYAENKQVWEEHTVIGQLNKIKPGKLAIIFDCGTADFFYEVNKSLHEQMLYLNIPHDYIERPGVHDGKYWNNAIDYQLMFFAKFFGAARK